MTVPPISAGFDPEPLLIESWRHFDKPKSAICKEDEELHDYAVKKAYSY